MVVKVIATIQRATMPPEIADSDEEPEISPPRPSASPIPENDVQVQPPSTFEQDPFAHLEFDQFLSPTQRLSSALPPQSTSSTDKFLLEIAQADGETFDSATNGSGFNGSNEQHGGAKQNKVKRSMSDIEGGKSRNSNDRDLQPAKRAKTYGSSRSQKSEVSSLFSDTADFYQHAEEESLGGRMLPPSDTTSIGLPVQQLVDPENLTRSAGFEEMNTKHSIHGYQQGATSFKQSSLQTSSSMNRSANGYQGFSMDFRGAGLSLDMSANPFGSLSQVSLDGDLDPSQTEKFASLFHHSQQSNGDTQSVSSVGDSGVLKPSHLKEMATSPIKQPSITSEHNFKVLPPESKKAPKKRGRKPKANQSNIEKPVSGIDTFQRLQSEDPLNIPPENYKPRPSRSRAGTVDSVNSSTSRGRPPMDSPKRKRKRSRTPDMVQVADSKQLSSELNLSDPAMIGAPKEMYVPRASKSRTKRVVIDEDDNADELQVVKATEQQEAIAVTDSNDTPQNEIATVQPTSTKKKSTKKSKCKRAKASANASIDENQDVIAVDEPTTKLELDPLPEVKLNKSKVTDSLDLDLHEEQKQANDDTKTSQGPNPAVKISIDIPKLRPEIEPEFISKPEPKKRGRKPKKKPDIKIQDEPTNDEPEAQPKAQPNPPNDTEPETEPPPLRPALTDKDPNTTQPPSTSKPSPQPDLKPPPRSSTPTGPLWSKPRVGLSKRLTIPSLLRKLDRSKEGPKVHERREKLSKKQTEAEEKRRMEAEDNGEVYQDKWEMRGKDGMLLEWDE